MSYMKRTLPICLALTMTAGAVHARDQIQVAGSSTVLPYATIVAEIFGESSDFPAPVVESGGSSAGLKRFCEDAGTIDIANASRRIKESEIEACHMAGVKGIIEVQFGYDGVVFASDINGHAFEFTPEDWYRALAAQVLVDGALVTNPASSWKDVNPDLPDQPIMAFIPGTKHGTREVFDLNVITEGCRASGAEEELTALLGEEEAGRACTTLRNDGRAVEIDGDYSETLARIESDTNGIGVFGLSFYENNASRLQVASMNDVAPSAETIASGEYPVSRPLFFYLKQDHLALIPGLKDYAALFVSDEIAGPGGPLADYGLVPDPELAQAQAAISEERVLD